MITPEGSSACVKTMFSSVCQPGQKVIVDRCSHVSVIDSLALLGLCPVWMFRQQDENFPLGKPLGGEEIEKALELNPDVSAVFITGEDYYGFSPDVAAISAVCRRFGLPLLVDNAHGAYLNFFKKHPMQLGASMCCDSWHKTLPALGAAAVLHMAQQFDSEVVKTKMRFFSSTSPSYLVMLSMDLCADYLCDEFNLEFKALLPRLLELKQEAHKLGFRVLNKDYPSVLKLTISGLEIGKTGFEIASQLREQAIEPEYADYNCVVLLVSPFNKKSDFLRVKEVLVYISAKSRGMVRASFFPGCAGEKYQKKHSIWALPKNKLRPVCYNLKHKPEVAMDVRSATFAPGKRVLVEESEGKVAALERVNCPPGLPVVVPGEVISKEAVLIMQECGVREINIIS